VCGIAKLENSIKVSIYEGCEFRNLLHLELAFRRAADNEARAWLSRKYMVTMSVSHDLQSTVNQLSVIKFNNEQLFLRMK